VVDNYGGRWFVLGAEIEIVVLQKGWIFQYKNKTTNFLVVK